MLDRIRVKNFKAHVDTEIDLKPITIFIGPNNSGKSTLFQLILLFKQCLNQHVKSHVLYPYQIDRSAHKDQNDHARIDFNEDILIDLGDDRLGLLNDILKPVTIEIKGHARLKEEKIRKIGYKMGNVEISLTLDDELRVTKARYHGKIDEEFENEYDSENTIKDKNYSEFKYPGYDITSTIKFSPDTLTPFFIEGVSSSGDIDESVRKKANIIRDNIADLFKNLIRSIHYSYGIRGFEAFCEPLSGSKLDRVEFVTLEYRSMALGNVALSSGELQEKIQEWFDRILGIKIYPELYEGKQVTFKLRSSMNRLLINEGLGSQQMLHMFIPIALAEEFDSIIIEEPEIHLHPRTQAELMELFIRVNREEKKQFIMSTHSEHIIYPLLSAISRGELKKEDVGIVFFTRDEKGVKVKELEIDEKGRVRGGLPGFFEQNLDEMIGYLNG